MVSTMKNVLAIWLEYPVIRIIILRNRLIHLVCKRATLTKTFFCSGSCSYGRQFSLTIDTLTRFYKIIKWYVLSLLLVLFIKMSVGIISSVKCRNAVIHVLFPTHEKVMPDIRDHVFFKILLKIYKTGACFIYLAVYCNVQAMKHLSRMGFCGSPTKIISTSSRYPLASLVEGNQRSRKSRGNSRPSKSQWNRNVRKVRQKLQVVE